MGQDCRIAHTEGLGGTRLPSHLDLASVVAYGTDHLPSRSGGGTNLKPTDLALPAPMGMAPHITSDPPFHATARRMLLPSFSHRPIAALEP